MRHQSYDDYLHSDEARERDLMIIWECDKCGRERRDYPGVNKGGSCECGGEFIEAGENYTV